ncbi:hypothetical protein GFS31_36540 [Leptolyngbya sp. BL0902]|uniref:hypothetical protein n=1 Tax=Leptolyngbya sp. BL0902 TaxID=1115757 RepID=UPI0018E7B4B3|nr:hypothetical protein [Leptolyngbya sp. BL0902]QQE66949.1 hypothetical protein GFS31_36540 [Leptolyngbya sp. BL0902]
MHWLKTTTIASSLAVASCLGTVSIAQAQTVSVPFNGTVVSTCVFDVAAIVPGRLILDPLLPTQLITDTEGSVPITCNGDVDLSVAEPREIIVQTATPVRTATATLAGQTALSVGPIVADVTGPLLNELVSVSMTATGLLPLADGFYSYEVDVTALPQ